MKSFYNIKDRVWIHLGSPKLVEGRVVDIINLEHLNESYNKEHELYIIEIKTSIENIYEVRTFDQISATSTGPIFLYKELAQDLNEMNRLLKRVGMTLPVNSNNEKAPSKKAKRRYHNKKSKTNP